MVDELKTAFSTQAKKFEAHEKRKLSIETSELLTRPIYLNIQVLNWKIIIAIVIASMYFHLILFIAVSASSSSSSFPSLRFFQSNLYSSLFRFFTFLPARCRFLFFSFAF